MEREWLTYAQAGELLGLSRSTVIRLVNAGALPVTYTSPRRPKILRADVEAYLERKRIVKTPDSNEAKNEPKV